VPWRPQGVPLLEEESAAAAQVDTESFTGFIQRGGG
jgi:hypothetical protein